MKNLLSKKKLFLSFLFLNTVMIGILFIIPLSNKAIEYAQLYTQALIEPFPEMKIHADKIEFLDPVPVKLTIGDSIQVICDTLYDEDCFTGFPGKSVFITEKIIYLKTTNGVKQIDVASLNIDNSEKNIKRDEIRSFLDNYAKIIFRAASVVLLLLLFLFLLLFNTLCAGIGFMVDAFENGKFNFTQLLNISAIFLTVFLVFNYVLNLLNLLSFKILSINIVLFYLLIAGVVYYLSKVSRFSFNKT